MKTIYFILSKLNNEIEESFVVHNKEEYDDNKDEICFSYYLPDELNTKDSYYVITGDGEYYRVLDINKIKQEKNKLIEFGTDNVKKDTKSFEDKAELMMKSENKFTVVRGCVIKSTIFSIIEKSLEDNKEEIKRDSIDAIIKERKDNFEIKTELDYLNNMIENCIKDKEGLEIEECYYNGKPIDSEDILYELQTHYFPNYITQKNIEDTLSDYYCIKTNKGTILRKKDTGEIIILSPNTNIPEEYFK